MKRFLSFAFVLCCLCLGYALKPVYVAADADSGHQQAVVDYACQSDADCVIKDVGNCCGYYPQCVNINANTNPEHVKKTCDEQGMVSACGFPSIDACRCSEAQRCEGVFVGGAHDQKELSH